MTITEKKNRAATWILTLKDDALLHQVLDLMKQSQRVAVRPVPSTLSYREFRTQTFDLDRLKQEQQVKRATPHFLNELAERANLTESMDELLGLLD